MFFLAEGVLVRVGQGMMSLPAGTGDYGVPSCSRLSTLFPFLSFTTVLRPTSSPPPLPFLLHLSIYPMFPIISVNLRAIRFHITLLVASVPRSLIYT